MENKTKLRIALASVTIFFLILIGYQLYLVYIKQEYDITVEALVVGQFEFFVTFTFSSYKIFFATMLIFGIFVLPFVINELGFLDNSTHEPIDNFDMEKGQTIEEAEEQFDRFAGFLKSRFGSVNKIRNYSLPVGIATVILGGCLITLPSIFLIDLERVKRVFETGEFIGQEYWYIAKYYGLIRGQLLLIGILFLVIGLILIIRYIRRNSHSTDKQ
jgi:uncharacterized membrane protein